MRCLVEETIGTQHEMDCPLRSANDFRLAFHLQIANFWKVWYQTLTMPQLRLFWLLGKHAVLNRQLNADAVVRLIKESMPDPTIPQLTTKMKLPIETYANALLHAS